MFVELLWEALHLLFYNMYVLYFLCYSFFLSFSLWDRLALERKKICTDFFACSSSRSWWYLIQSSVIPLLFYFVWWTNSSASVLIFSLNFTFSDSSELHQSTKGEKKHPDWRIHLFCVLHLQFYYLLDLIWFSLLGFLSSWRKAFDLKKAKHSFLSFFSERRRLTELAKEKFHLFSSPHLFCFCFPSLTSGFLI